VTTKRALVTGASEGIGRAFATRLAKDGFQVTAVARTEARLKELIAELGTGHEYRVADLSKTSDVAAIAQLLRTQKFDLLVNNAGVGLYGAFEKVPLEKIQNAMRLNVDALVALAHAFLETASSGDALLNVSSTLGFGSFPFNGVYAATKAFILSFSESLWFEQKDRGVYVLALCPGITKTLFHAAAGGKPENRPPDKLAQTAEQVVDAAISALSARSKPTLIPGAMNKSLMFFASRLLSRKGAINMMGGFAVRD
jgi:short-subunit dehydrogenase